MESLYPPLSPSLSLIIQTFYHHNKETHTKARKRAREREGGRKKKREREEREREREGERGREGGIERFHFKYISRLCMISFNVKKVSSPSWGRRGNSTTPEWWMWSVFSNVLNPEPIWLSNCLIRVGGWRSFLCVCFDMDESSMLFFRGGLGFPVPSGVCYSCSSFLVPLGLPPHWLSLKQDWPRDPSEPTRD